MQRRIVIFLATVAVVMGAFLVQHSTKFEAAATCTGANYSYQYGCPTTKGTHLTATESSTVAVIGKSVTVTLTLTNDYKQGTGGAPLGGQTVTIYQWAVAGSPTTVAASGTTDSSGHFSASFTPSVNTYYQGSYAGSGNTYNASTSNIVRHDVRVGVRVSPNSFSGNSGDTAYFTGYVIPNHTGKWVALQIFDSALRSWRYAGKRAYLDGNSRYVLHYRSATPVTLLFRVAYPTQDNDHAWNISKNVPATWA